MHQSIKTVDSPEFINLKPMDINPLMSQCEIKVLYVGQNRNGSYIDKATAIKMAETLRGCPIVGYFKDEKEDFADHGEKVTIDGGEIKFECMTVPYGFVAPDSTVWFKKFNDFDDFGNSVEREYLMTTGYLWTGQFKEAELAITEGRPQSMELDSSTLSGNWSQDIKSGMDFFIINDATFSKLCILGDDVEPCFEGASVTSPDVSTSFSLDDNFKNTLFSMMQDLKFALKGGQQMNSEKEQVQEEMLDLQDNSEQVDFEKTENDIEVDNAVEAPEVEFKSEKDEEEKADDSEKEPEEDKEEEEEEKKDLEKSACGGGDKEKKKYSLLEEELESLKEKYSLLEAENAELKEFKHNIELKEKEQLIDEFYMLSEEDKAEVKAKINEYSLREIKAELSMVCVDKKVNFNLEENTNNDAEAITTFSLQEEESNLPAWLAAVKATAKERNQ